MRGHAGGKVFSAEGEMSESDKVVDALRAENERLRSALEAIVDLGGPGDNSRVLDECATIARSAIRGVGR